MTDDSERAPNVSAQFGTRATVSKPLAIDLYAGLGGWTEGLLAEGWDVIGFDIERHRYPRIDFVVSDESKKSMSGKDKHGNTLMNMALERTHGFHKAKVIAGEWSEYPAQLVLQDVLTLHGAQFKSVDLIVASPPCQEYSYMAMPWSRAKAIAAEYREGKRDVKQLTALFDACFRIQREAIEAAGHFIPLVVENVRGAIPWVGRSRWNYGSFHLWGDVPALMPMTMRLSKMPGASLDRNRSDAGIWGPHHSRAVDSAIKNTGGSWFNIGAPGQKVCGMNPDGRKLKDQDGYPRDHPEAFGWNKPRTSSGSSKRKAASAMIAKIPLPLSRHIAKTYYPNENRDSLRVA